MENHILLYFTIDIHFVVQKSKKHQFVEKSWKNIYFTIDIHFVVKKSKKKHPFVKKKC